MKDLGSTRIDGLNNASRRKRNQTSRTPRPDSPLGSDGHDLSSFSSTLHSDDAGKVSSDENGGDDRTSSKRKEFNLNHCVSQVSSGMATEDEKSHMKSKKDAGFQEFYKNEMGRNGLYSKHCSKGVLAPASWKGSSKSRDNLESEVIIADVCGGRNFEVQSLEKSKVPQVELRNENRVKKVKLKVGGVMHTIQANTTPNSAFGSGSTKNTQFSKASSPQQKQQGHSDDNHPRPDKRSGLQVVPQKDLSRVGFGFGKEDSLMEMAGENTFGKQEDKFEPLRKSKRIPKRRVLDEEFSVADNDEIWYSEKLKTPKASAVNKDDNELSKKHQKVSSMEDAALSRLSKDVKKNSRSNGMYAEKDYEGEEGSGSDVVLDDKKRRQRKKSDQVLMEGKREITLTARQRALQSSKDGSGTSLIEFPNGLPPAPPRKQKEKLSEVDQQLKKAEAAQKRRMQVEKAARESEAEAIRKILGQDSNRKKREEKMKKRQEELAQEKAANARKLASTTVRIVDGPAGKVVTFPEEMGLPSIFNSKPCSYPSPRVKCMGPSCTNPYKYRDSKTKLPLCSLQCYKAVQEGG